MGQTGHPKHLAEIRRKLHLGTAKHQRRQQPAALRAGNLLQTSLNPPTQVGNRCPGLTQQLQTWSGQPTPAAMDRQTLGSSRQQRMLAIGWALQRSFHLHTPTLQRQR